VVLSFVLNAFHAAELARLDEFSFAYLHMEEMVLKVYLGVAVKTSTAVAC
jgi:hypothetical protein